MESDCKRGRKEKEKKMGRRSGGKRRRKGWEMRRV